MVPRLLPTGEDSIAGVRNTATLLAVDPGLQRTGYAVLRALSGRIAPLLIEAGVVRLSPRDRLETRLTELAAAITSLLTTHRPARLICEALYAHYRHPRTAILMGHARGVILAAAGAAEVSVISVAATRVKKLLTGRGGASKRQMQHAVMATLGLDRLPEPHDVADAIAIGLAGLRQSASSAVPSLLGASR